MSQYPGGQPPQDPYYGPGGGDPYAPPPPQQPSDPYFGQAPADPYAPPPPQDPYYGQPQDPYAQQAQQAQQQAWAQQQAYYYGQPQAPTTAQGGRSGVGAAIVGIFLVALGAWFLFRDEVALDFGRVWPILAVGLGVLMVLAAFIPRREA